MMRYLRFSSLILIVCFVVACGFHLRGAYNLPAHLSPLYLDKETMSLQLFRELRSALKTSGVELTEDSTAAASILNVDFEQKARDVISVDSLGRAREYRLIYRLTFSLRVEEDTEIERSNIQLTRNLLFNPETVLGVEQEMDNIYKDMIMDSSRQILQRLQTLN